MADHHASCATRDHGSCWRKVARNIARVDAVGPAMNRCDDHLSKHSDKRRALSPVSFVARSAAPSK